ncbi:hypothetical protein [Klebsiella sp. RIT-PI-d]|uniref:hypothetical protein n=1 Tax=Klebsiella sp. RIT-PI-d TaxID=1681196 RepID=UPI000AB43D50|nr:hypothetical protein [Klebsiella sp. RIT-PI-d]
MIKIGLHKWIFLFTSALCGVLDAHGAAIYGFAQPKCSLWSTFFPVSFQVSSDMAVIPGLVDAETAGFNIFYITGGDFHNMDDYYDLYTINGGHVWNNTSPWLINGRNAVMCKGSSDCVKSGTGSIGKGISAYNSLKAEFPDENIKVASDRPYSNGDIDWYYIPTRRLKLLRVEFFTPNKGSMPGTSQYVEPIFFEYRETGNGDEMKLYEMGGTARGADFSHVKLPETIKLTTLSAMQIWMSTASGKPYENVMPYGKVVPFTDSQIAMVPKGCL